MNFREAISDKSEYNLRLIMMSKEEIVANYERLLYENLELKDLIKRLEIAILQHNIKMDIGLHHDLDEALNDDKKVI